MPCSRKPCYTSKAITVTGNNALNAVSAIFYCEAIKIRIFFLSLPTLRRQHSSHGKRSIQTTRKCPTRTEAGRGVRAHLIEKQEIPGSHRMVCLHRTIDDHPVFGCRRLPWLEGRPSVRSCHPNRHYRHWPHGIGAQERCSVTERHHPVDRWLFGRCGGWRHLYLARPLHPAGHKAYRPYPPSRSRKPLPA